MKKRNRIRINKRMMAWSNGERANIIPSVNRQVDDYGHLMCEYLSNLDEGYEIYWGDCTVARNKCRLIEYEADRYWEQGKHREALNEMMRAARRVLPDDEPAFEDVQWLNPEETLYWHPNIREYLRYNLRCIELCKKDPRLWPLYNGSSIERNYHTYLDNLNYYLHN